MKKKTRKDIIRTDEGQQCSNPDCLNGDTVQPYGNFKTYKNSKGETKYRFTCKRCKSKDPTNYKALTTPRVDMSKVIRTDEGKTCANPDCLYGTDIKPYSSFWFSNTSPDGYRPRCKRCMNADPENYIDKPVIIKESWGKSCSCPTCLLTSEVQPFSFFAKDKSSLDGYSYICRTCTATKIKNKAKNNKPLEGGIRICKICKVGKDITDFRVNRTYKSGREFACKDCMIAINKLKQYTRVTEGTRICTKCGVEKHIDFYMSDKRNKQGISTKCRECTNKHVLNHYANNINAKLASDLRKRLCGYVSKGDKVGSAVSDLGCTISYLKYYLESYFYSNPETGELMTWDNRGKDYDNWQIDHIIPLSSFDLTDRAQLLKAYHYTNLQPMWSYANNVKGNRMPEEWAKISDKYMHTKKPVDIVPPETFEYMCNTWT